MEKKKKKKPRTWLRGNDDCFPPRHQSGKNRKNRTLSPSLIARTRMLRVFLNVPLLFSLFFFILSNLHVWHEPAIIHISRISSRDLLRFSFLSCILVIKNKRNNREMITIISKILLSVILSFFSSSFALEDIFYIS